MAYLNFGKGSRWYVWQSSDDDDLHVHFEDREVELFDVSRAKKFLRDPDWEIFYSSSITDREKDSLLSAMREFLKRQGENDSEP